MSDWPSKLISWVADHVLLSNKVWSSSNQNYSKNNVFVSITTCTNVDLDIWPWPLSFSMIVTNLQMQTVMFLRRKTKKLKKNQFLRYDVTKRRHNVKKIVDLESTHQDLSNEVLHDMVLYGTFDFKIWSSGMQISTCCKTHEGQGRSAPNANQLSSSSFTTLTPSLELIW
jgi:hypothetical protein